MVLQERVLFILAALLSPGEHSYHTLQSYLGPEYKIKSLYALLRRMDGDKLVKRSLGKSISLVRLRSSGKDSLINEYGHWGLQKHQWDGAWRVALYDVPEKNRYIREKIRTTLRHFGFGGFQQSVYISPFDTQAALRDHLAQEGLLDNILILSATSNQLGDARLLANRVFRLQEFAQSYMGLMRRFQIVRGQQLESKLQIGIQRVRSDFVELAGRDPFLPPQLLPIDWPFDRVRTLLEGLGSSTKITNDS